MSAKMDFLASARKKAVKASPARDRISLLFDEGSFTELDAFAKAEGASAGVVTGYGAIEGVTVFAFAQDKTDASGAVGKVQAAKIKKLYELALKTGSPVVGIYDSFGGALREGNDMLAAYGEMMLWSSNLSGVVPQISVIAGTCAGTAALLAAGADLVVMSETAEYFLTAPSIEKAQGSAAKGAGSASNAADAGVAHITAKTPEEAIATAKHLVSMLPQNNLSPLPIFDFTAHDGAAEALNSACESDTRDAAVIVENVFDEGSIVELMPSYGKKGAYTALATIGGFTCGVAATRGGALCRKNCKKLSILMQLCDAYQIPVVSFVDATGFVADGEAELAGLAKYAAGLAHIYAEATTPKVAVITGKAYGSAYIALAGKSANADLTYAWPSAVISALEPQAAVAIMQGDNVTADNDMAAVTAKYIAEEASPYKACEQGYVDDVIVPADTRDVLISALDVLSGKRVNTLSKKHSNLPL
ncbi:MAG: carboxyl transferase domain-containing protein [Hydrogenoanaerobacterium sp.]